MKQLLALLLICVSCTAFAQDPMYNISNSNKTGPCKDTKRQVNEFTNEVTIASSAVMNGAGYVMIGKTIKDSTETLVAIFSISTSRPVYGSKGVYIKFDDGTIYKDEIAEIDCKYSSGSSYWLTGMMLINEENKEYFLNKKIAKYALNTTSNEIKDKSAEKIQLNFKCVSDTK
ncbi:hypothetical protein [Pontibacter sp. HSC-36F09]|uniref:hypothetical protein n=1 Tax=Pontibacter sp. HSC-36F09 TaxID=2910966 RepID=UPI0020A10DDE|nr:hypothetical protein [Pontibacter sp. HSC-36F09]MCP2043493.1 hypothetical protein [Pontibacter sp. HSC-36F09]